MSSLAVYVASTYRVIPELVQDPAQFVGHWGDNLQEKRKEVDITKAVDKSKGGGIDDQGYSFSMLPW